ncbi:hypothetical protein PINS_up008011 [Pythium insidiosum]|nr:hypothetical protein PINS_up008011 [Pythium insidiosum]
MSAMHVRSHCHAMLRVAVLVLVAFPLATMAKTSSAASKDDVRPLSDITVTQALAVVFIAVGLALASAGGIGGGTIIVPTLVLAMGFDIKFATPSSNFIIMGGAIANAIFNLRKRHPYADRPLVDPDICLAMIPSMMGGAVVGAFFSKLLPSYVISILLVLLLAMAGVRTTQKALRLHKAEVAKRAPPPLQDFEPLAPSRVASPAAFHALQSPAPETETDVAVPVAADVNGPEESKTRDEQVEEIMAYERRFNWRKHALLVICYLGIVAATVGGAVLPCGGVAYWLLLWAEIPWVACFTALFVAYMNKQQALKRSLNYPTIHGDIQWTRRTVLFFPVGCTIAGVVAGMFGVGGAIIAGPLMLEMGVLPEVASSTSALLVLYSSAAATAKFALFKQIVWDWSVLLCVIAFGVTMVAQVCILGFVRRTGRQSIIVFCVAITVCVGACLMAYSAVRSTVRDAGKSFSIQFCSK